MKAPSRHVPALRRSETKKKSRLTLRRGGEPSSLGSTTNLQDEQADGAGGKAIPRSRLRIRASSAWAAGGPFALQCDFKLACPASRLRIGAEDSCEIPPDSIKNLVSTAPPSSPASPAASVIEYSYSLYLIFYTRQGDGREDWSLLLVLREPPSRAPSASPLPVAPLTQTPAGLSTASFWEAPASTQSPTLTAA